MCSSPRRRRRRGLFALLAQFAHDLCDVNRGTGGHLGSELLLLLPEDDGAETGPSVFRILLQLGVTGRREDVIHEVWDGEEKEEERRGGGQTQGET